MAASQYTIRQGTISDFSLGSPDWDTADVLEVALFHSRSSSHRPRTSARVLYDSANLYVRFDVEDQFVRCVATEYQQPVCQIGRAHV